MFDLFGDGMPLPAKFFIAFAVVLALIGLSAWLVRRFSANRLGGGNARGRQPRLAVIDASPVDGRRRLVLIRRDNVEHLLMIGGPTDVVVEQNIVRGATSTREPARGEPSRIEPSRSEPAARGASAAETNSWPLQPAGEPTPVAAPRPYRTAATEEPWLPPEPGARARPVDNNSLTGLAAELSTRLTPPEPAPVARSEPPARPAPPAPAVAAPEPVATAQANNDHNLAEMAQQLEAALRRAPAPEGRPPVTDPLAAPLARPAERAPARDYKLRIDPKFETKGEPRFDMPPEPRVEPRAEPRMDARQDSRPMRQPAPAASKNVFDNLEEEMASLLGRPPGRP